MRVDGDPFGADGQSPQQAIEHSQRQFLIAYPEFRVTDGGRDRLRDDLIYARRAVLQEWLRELGYQPETLLVLDDDTRSQEERRLADVRAQEACVRLWLEERGQETPISARPAMKKPLVGEKTFEKPSPNW